MIDKNCAAASADTKGSGVIGFVSLSRASSGRLSFFRTRRTVSRNDSSCVLVSFRLRVRQTGNHAGDAPAPEDSRRFCLWVCGAEGVVLFKVFWQKDLCDSSARADSQNPGHDRRAYFFTYNNLTGRSIRCTGDRRPIEHYQGVSASGHDSLSRGREVASLAHALPEFLEPRALQSPPGKHGPAESPVHLSADTGACLRSLIPTTAPRIAPSGAPTVPRSMMKSLTLRQE